MTSPTPRLDVAIVTFGTRGDTQPFIRVAQELQQQGHRVRITVSPAHEAWIRDEYGLEAWPLGYDMAPAIVLHQAGKSYKTKAMVNGEFARMTKGLKRMFEEHWRVCWAENKDRKDERPFVADAIIASPPPMTHFNIAQRLSVPLHLVHANPRSATKAWPHSERNPCDAILKDCEQNYQSWHAEEAK